MSSKSKRRRIATVFQQGEPAGRLEEVGYDKWRFTYLPGFEGRSVSLTMPVRPEPYEHEGFPPAFEGLLPEGIQLEALLRTYKIDREDSFSQLLVVGADMVGSLTVERIDEPVQEEEA